MNRLERLQWLIAWFNQRRSELQTQPAMVAAIKADPEVENTLRDIYFALFNRPLSGCSSCLADALIEVLYSQKRMEQIVKCNFKLKQGVLLQDSKGVLPMATVANLTDEIAIAYLRDNRKRIDMFEEGPENLDELLKGKAPKADKSPDDGHGAETGAQGEENPEGEQEHGSEEKAPENEEKQEDSEELTAEAIEAMDYNALKAEVAKRGLKPASTKRPDLIDALLSSL